ncbi:MAG: L-lactate permease [Verrucomicrobiota bacterium]
MNWDPNLLGLIVFAPFIAAPIMFYALKWELHESFPLYTLIYAFIAFFIWKVKVAVLAAGFLYAVATAFKIGPTLCLIAFAVATIRESKVLEPIRDQIKHLTKDPRILAIMVCWFFGSTIDTFFGFSQTSLCCSFILAGCGLPPACIVTMCVLGPMVSSAFCSAAMPITINMVDSLQGPEFFAYLRDNELTLRQFLQLVVNRVVVLHGILGMFIPWVMIMVMTRYFGRKRSWTDGFSAVPFALFCGLAFVVPYGLMAIFGPFEFASITGGVVGGLIAVIALKTGFLVPHDIWEFPPESEWEPNWKPEPIGVSRATMPAWKAWIVFALLLAVMIVIRVTPLADILFSYSLEWKNVFGTNIHIRYELFYMTMLYFLIIVAFCKFFYKPPSDSYREALGAWGRILGIICSLYGTCAVFTTFIHNTSANTSGLPGMVEVLAQWFASWPLMDYIGPMFPAMFGLIGTFAAQNIFHTALMFSSLSFNLANALDMSAPLFLALQHTGGCAGELLSEHWLAGSGVLLGLLGWETPASHKVALPCILYVILLGMLGILFTQLPELGNFLFLD